MKKIITLAVSVSLLALSAAAQAEEGFYVGIAGGGNHVHDDKLKSPTVNGNAEYDWGWAGVGTLGYKYDNGLRSELELGYRRNGADKVSGFAADGRVAAASAMLNVLYDFDISETALNTYIGAGAGVVNVDYNRLRAAGSQLINESDTAPAVQGIVGASYPVASSTDAFVNYQYLHAVNTSFHNANGASVNTDYDSSTVLVGLKFNMYGTPAPAPQPAPVAAAAPQPAPAAPAPAPEPISRTYLVFFDFDKSELSQEALSVLQQAADDAKAGNAIAVKVVGHADRAGTDAYNMSLSNRRASTVKETLAQLGITDSNIQTTAKGESDPLVPTEDGVREPQNRRVEIMYVIDGK